MSLNYWSIEDIRNEYSETTASLSSALRQLVFAEGAATWILFEYTNKQNLSCWFIFVYVFIFAFLLFDVFQYLCLSIQYHGLAKKMHKKGKSRIRNSDKHIKFKKIWFDLKLLASFLSGMSFGVYAYLSLST